MRYIQITNKISDISVLFITNISYCISLKVREKKIVYFPLLIFVIVLQMIAQSSVSINHLGK